ncbi:EpsG family protein [Enterobacter hormaechei]|nr:EpsG family protein [Enterobacter hormaechei]
MTSYIIYNSAVLFCLLFAYLYERANEVVSQGIKRLYLSLSFSSLLLLSALRFDVGPDYETYVDIYYNFINAVISFSPDKLFYGLLSLSFSTFERGYIYVLGIYAFFTLFFVYKTLIERQILIWGLVVFCFIGFYLDSFDRVRQLLAVAIFLYSIKYIEEQRLLKYTSWLLFATFIHFSAILLFPVYLFNKFRIKPLAAFSILICLFIMHIIGLTSGIQSYIYSHIPYYNSIYGESQFSESQGGFGTGLGFLFNILIIFYTLLLLKHNKVLWNLLFAACFLMLLSPGNLNIMRFSQYFYISLIVAFPYTFKLHRHSGINKLIAFSLLFVFFQAQQGRNNYNYQSIFSTNFEQEYFTPRVSERPILRQN